MSDSTYYLPVCATNYRPTKSACPHNLNTLAWTTIFIKLALSVDIRRYAVTILEDCVLIESLDPVYVTPKDYVFLRDSYNTEGHMLALVIRCPSSITSRLRGLVCTKTTRGGPSYRTWTDAVLERSSSPSIMELEDDTLSVPFTTKGITAKAYSSGEHLAVTHRASTDQFNPLDGLVGYHNIASPRTEHISFHATFSLFATPGVRQYRYTLQPFNMKRVSALPKTIFSVCDPSPYHVLGELRCGSGVEEMPFNAKPLPPVTRSRGGFSEGVVVQPFSEYYM